MAIVHWEDDPRDRDHELTARLARDAEREPRRTLRSRRAHQARTRLAAILGAA